MKYDDAEYYFLDFETELPNENGGRHIGLFLEWAVLRGLANDELMARKAEPNQQPSRHPGESRDPSRHAR